MQIIEPDFLQHRILVVDDEPFNLLALKQMVKLSSFKDLHRLIDTASNGEDCIKKIKAAKANNIFHSLIFMDLSMPIKDGYEATMELRDLHKNSQIQPKVIAVSGHVDSQYILKAWRYGLDEFVYKPIKLSVLNKILGELYE